MHRPLKRLGQNFLEDQEIASSIVSLADPGLSDVVLEPGAGYGTLTHRLAKKAGLVVAVEKDKYLASHLRQEFKDTPSVRVIEGDVLRTLLPPFNKVVGTPPYYLSSKLVLFLLKTKPEQAYLVLQKEFGERLLAQPGSPDYGRLSVTAQRALHIKALTSISRTAFKPVPKVDSVLLQFAPKALRVDIDDEIFDEIVRGLFNQRRRLLKSSLLHFLKLKTGEDRAREILSGMRLPEERVYELSVDYLEELSRQLAPVLKDR